VLAPHYAERALSVAGALIDRARYVQRIEHEISVACDEWNVWYRGSTEIRAGRSGPASGCWTPPRPG
jgi:alpha-L-arabinofuranosidase